MRRSKRPACRCGALAGQVERVRVVANQAAKPDLLVDLDDADHQVKLMAGAPRGRPDAGRRDLDGRARAYHQRTLRIHNR